MPVTQWLDDRVVRIDPVDWRLAIGGTALSLADLRVMASDDVTAVLDDDPLWLVAIKAVAIFTLLLLMTLFMIWFERRVVGRMQHRPGPNRVGPFGLLQSLADGLKLVFKDDIRPLMAYTWFSMLAPILAGGAGVGGALEDDRCRREIARREPLEHRGTVGTRRRLARGRSALTHDRGARSAPGRA